MLAYEWAMVKYILSALLLCLTFSIANAAEKAASAQDNATIAAMPCAELKNPINRAKFEKIDIKDFADWYLTKMQKKYPEKDIATFKYHVMTYEPIKGKARDKNPFVFLSAMACTDGQEIKDGLYGDNLEESLLWMLEQRKSYFEHHKSEGK